MSKDLEKICRFIDEHHVMSLATWSKGKLSACNLFYAFDVEQLSFVVASSKETHHIQDIQENPNIAGTIVLQTKTVGKIQGLQFRGVVSPLEEKTLEKLYFKSFPYALAMSPTLWKIEIDFFKLTDNRLGFGKKILWER